MGVFQHIETHRFGRIDYGLFRLAAARYGAFRLTGAGEGTVVMDSWSQRRPHVRSQLPSLDLSLTLLKRNGDTLMPVDGLWRFQSKRHASINLSAQGWHSTSGIPDQYRDGRGEPNTSRTKVYFCRSRTPFLYRHASCRRSLHCA